MAKQTTVINWKFDQFGADGKKKDDKEKCPTLGCKGRIDIVKQKAAGAVYDFFCGVCGNRCHYHYQQSYLIPGANSPATMQEEMCTTPS